MPACTRARHEHATAAVKLADLPYDVCCVIADAGNGASDASCDDKRGSRLVSEDAKASLSRRLQFSCTGCKFPVLTQVDLSG